MTPNDDLVDDLGGQHRPEPRLSPVQRVTRIAFFTGGCAVIAVVVAFLALLFGLHANHRADVNAGKVNAFATALASANTSVVNLGGTPLPTPSSAAPAPTATVTVSGPPGATGPAGEGQGPTADQVLAAVTAYCASHECGSGPTAQQVAQAVATYCATGVCQGTVGPAGANASPDQIAAAVASYCSDHGNCAGPEGSAGPTGPTGPTGPSGVSGTSGTDGASGAPGQGVPSFTFTVPGLFGNTTYTCVAPDYACTSS